MVFQRLYFLFFWLHYSSFVELTYCCLVEEASVMIPRCKGVSAENREWKHLKIRWNIGNAQKTFLKNL